MNLKLTGKLIPILEYMIYICIDMYSIPLHIRKTAQKYKANIKI